MPREARRPRGGKVKERLVPATPFPRESPARRWRWTFLRSGGECDYVAVDRGTQLFVGGFAPFGA